MISPRGVEAGLGVRHGRAGDQDVGVREGEEGEQGLAAVPDLAEQLEARVPLAVRYVDAGPPQREPADQHRHPAAERDAGHRGELRRARSGSGRGRTRPGRAPGRGRPAPAAPSAARPGARRPGRPCRSAGTPPAPTISAVGRLSRCSTALSTGASARQTAPSTRALRSPTPSTTRSIATTWSGWAADPAGAGGLQPQRQHADHQQGAHQRRERAVRPPCRWCAPRARCSRRWTGS